ncbi:MAG: hypothetical protein H0T72_02740 [Chloroflexia bacterium]|nr:hypothetical protein [Chloroflexia bacterium]
MRAAFCVSGFSCSDFGAIGWLGRSGNFAAVNNSGILISAFIRVESAVGA